MDCILNPETSQALIDGIFQASLLTSIPAFLLGCVLGPDLYDCIYFAFRFLRRLFFRSTQKAA